MVDSITLLTKESNGWYEIEYNGVVGYISGDKVLVKNKTRFSSFF